MHYPSDTSEERAKIKYEDGMWQQNIYQQYPEGGSPQLYWNSPTTAAVPPPLPSSSPGAAPMIAFPQQDPGYIRPRPVSYSNSLPDTVREIVDNDTERRGKLGELPMDAALLAQWTSESRLVQFTVDELPSYYATWTATGHIEWCIWTVPRIAGIALFSKEVSNTAAESVLRLLYRTDQVHVSFLQNCEHATSMVAFLRDESKAMDDQVYLYLNKLPEFIETNVNEKAAFINSASLSRYQKALSSVAR